MRDTEIISIIDDIHNKNSYYKDGGLSFISELTKKLDKTNYITKMEVIAFFLKEITYNKNGYEEIGIVVLQELGNIEIAPYIEQIYINHSQSKTEKWKYSLIETMFKLRYTEPKLLYFKFVQDFIKKTPIEKHLFLLIQYCNVDSESAIPLLAEYYSNYLTNRGNISDFIESRIGFLYSYFSKNPKNNFKELLEKIALKNKENAIYLQKLLLKHLDSDFVIDTTKEELNRKKEELSNYLK
jgi:hypothetical protein